MALRLKSPLLNQLSGIHTLNLLTTFADFPISNQSGDCWTTSRNAGENMWKHQNSEGTSSSVLTWRQVKGQQTQTSLKTNSINRKQISHLLHYLFDKTHLGWASLRFCKMNLKRQHFLQDFETISGLSILVNVQVNHDLIKRNLQGCQQSVEEVQLNLLYRYWLWMTLRLNWNKNHQVF